jgi:hypothetical protein
MQLTVGTLMLYMSLNVQKLLDEVGVFLSSYALLIHLSASREVTYMNSRSCSLHLSSLLPHKVRGLHSLDRTFIFKLRLDIAVDGNGCCEHTDRDAISDF